MECFAGIPALAQTLRLMPRIRQAWPPFGFRKTGFRYLVSFSKSGVLLALLLAGSMWFYVQQVLIAHQESYAAAHDIPRGNLSDLYPRWLGARELLLHRRNPYSSDITREIQIGYYGRALDPGRREDPEDQQGFAYPVYVVFLLAPTIGLPFWIVQIAARWLLIILTAASVPLWLRILRWRPSASLIAALIILVVGSFQSIQAIKLQQLSLLVNGLIVVAVLLLVEDRHFLAGVLLALATIKPQLVLLLAAWLLFWAASNWRARKNFVFGFIGTALALVAGGELVLPRWIGQFHEAILAYRRYNDGAGSTLDLLFQPAWGKVLTIAIILGLCIVGWRFRHTPHHEPAFSWMIALILAATVVIVPKAAPYNQVLLVGPALLIIQHLNLWRRGPWLQASLLIAAAIVFWPWLAAFVIALAAPFVSAAELQRAWAAPIYTSLAIPLVIFALAAFVINRLSKAGDNDSGTTAFRS